MGFFSFLRGTRENTFSVGDGSDGNKKIEAAVPGANKPSLRFNSTSGKWEVSHNGTDYFDFVGATAVQTLTNKRINPREQTEASSATPTPAGDTADIYTITALAEAATFSAPSGTPVQGQKLIIRIKDNATARALAWNAIYRAGTAVSLPSTTTVSKTLYCGFMYNSTDSKWDLLAVTTGF